jgi:hypothetical protein
MTIHSDELLKAILGLVGVVGAAKMVMASNE